MDQVDLTPLVDQLGDDIDELEEALSTLTEATLAETTSKLPLLDKANLFVLVTYAIESILFSYLRLSGVIAKDHPVYRELARVKHYFQKIKGIEERSQAPNKVLDKDAAGRIIKHGLAGNDKYDAERAEDLVKQRARTHIRFEEPPVESESPAKAEDVPSASREDVSMDDTAEVGDVAKAKEGQSRTEKTDSQRLMDENRNAKIERRQQKKEKRRLKAQIPPGTMQEDV